MKARRHLHLKLVVIAALALVFVGAALGFTAARSFVIRPGDRADFFTPTPGKPLGWSCSNKTRTVQCFSGDALPYAELVTVPCPRTGPPRRCGLAVKVYKLAGAQAGTVTRTSSGGRVVYLFTAF
jgi:hypothetical protein